MKEVETLETSFYYFLIATILAILISLYTFVVYLMNICIYSSLRETVLFPAATFWRALHKPADGSGFQPGETEACLAGALSKRGANSHAKSGVDSFTREI